VSAADDEPSLFWLALMLVSFVIIMIAGNRFLNPPSRRPPRRLLIVALACAIPPATVAPDLSWHSEGLAGWSSPYMPDTPLGWRHVFQHV
jgi:hypothetical protein